MSALPHRRFTEAEYLALEEKADYRSQYVSGEIFSMAGTELPHAQLQMNIGSLLTSSFRGKPCRALASETRVKVGDLYTYPDVLVVCGEPKLDRSSKPACLLNPQVIFEVLSPSTETFDRGDKFTRYKRIESLRDYVLVSAERVQAEHFTRTADNKWLLVTHDQPEHRLVLGSVECELPLFEIYDKVVFES